MRSAILLLLLALHAVSVRGQQIAQYTQYVFNHFSVNPAVAGSKDCLDVRLGFRKQWNGFPGAPTTGWATMHGSIRPKGKPYIANRHGFGANVEADQSGPIGYTHFYLAYAYHMQMAKDNFLSMGLFAGVKQEKVDIGDLNLADQGDPVLTNKSSVLVVPEITPGIWMYSKQGWAGLSVFQLLNNKVKGIGEDTRLSRHFVGSFGRRFRIDKSLAAVPSTLLKFSPGSPLAIDINVMLEYRRRMGLGVSYRNQDAVAFMIKFPFLKFFTFGYSYDITTSKIRVASSNTHEVILAIYPCAPSDPAKEIVRCPVFE